MDFLDLIIIALAVGTAIRGVEAGLFRQVGSFGGFVLGLVAGAALAPTVDTLATGSVARLALGLLALFGPAILLSALGEALGLWLGGVAGRFKLRWADEWGGAVFGAAAVLLSSWLLSSIFARVPSTTLAGQIQGSFILQTLDARLPPAPDFIARVESLMIPAGFPRVFAGLEPSPAPPVTGPNAAAINAAIAAGRAATVEIEGSGCGEIIEGSGFVVAPGLVATNAHVVAGVSAPVVTDAAGRHKAVVVSFDPNLDFAVLRVSGLAAAPLPLDQNDEARGAIGAALGYPGGGPFTASAAAILDKQTAVGRNIYDEGIVRRDIYELQAIVRPGNSGGPLVSPDGHVLGVIFATSTTNDDVGYALTSRDIINEVNASKTAGRVSTGACAG
jgi:S1-C subfamily serine protease